MAVLLGREGSGGCGLVGVALPGQEGSGDGIDYNDKDGGRRHKRGGADDNNKRQEGFLMTQGDNDGSNNGSGDVTLGASYSHCRLLRVSYSQHKLRV